MGKVLVLDDDGCTAELLREWVGGFSLSVDKFEDPELALQAFLNDPLEYSGAVLDIWFPYSSIDGFQIAQQMKQLSPKMKFLFVTGISNPKNVNVLEKHGDVIQKPLSICEHADVMKSFVAKLTQPATVNAL